MALPVLTSLDFGSAQRITNLPNAVGAQEPATLAQVNALIEGLNWKDNVRVASNSNVNISAPGTTIDGYTAVIGDRILLLSQTLGETSGCYIYNGAAVPMTRSVDSDTSGDITNAVYFVDGGSFTGTAWRQAVVTPVIGTTVLAFVQFGAASAPASTTTAGVMAIANQAEVNAGTVANKALTPATLAGWSLKPLRYATNIGDGSATLYTVTHNLNTRDVSVHVYENSGNYRHVFVEVRRTTVNAVVVVFDVAPTTNAYRVLILG